MLLKSLTRKIEKKYPLNLAEDWDNVGLIVGDFDMDVKKVLVSLEANEDVIDEASYIQKYRFNCDTSSFYIWEN